MGNLETGFHGSLQRFADLINGYEEKQGLTAPHFEESDSITRNMTSWIKTELLFEQWN